MSATGNRIKKRWRFLLYGFLAKYTLKLIGYTCRFKIKGIENLTRIAPEKKCILMLWHNRLAMVGEILLRHAPKLNYAALISDSRDGEMLSYFANSIPIGRSIRVPHDARSIALQTLIKEMKKTDDVIIITPDGPKGPAYKVKPGIVLAAKKTGAQIIPLTWTASRCWKLSTWDHLMIPKPFSTIHVTLGIPIETINEPERKFEHESARLEAALQLLEKNSHESMNL